MILYLVYNDTLLQNETDIITKCDSYFITKCDKSLLQHVPELFFKKYDSSVKKCDSYYKMLRLLQNKLLQILIFLKFQFAAKSVELVTNFRHSCKHSINQ